MFRWIFLVFLFFGSLQAQEKISTLLPGVPEVFQLKPALPKGTSVASYYDPPDVEQGVFWGAPLVLESYFAGELPLKGPIIAVKISDNVKQKGPNEFDGDAKMKRELKCVGRGSLKMKKLKWGPYPVLSVEAHSRSGTQYHIAWVGMNDEEGTTLMFNYLVPESKNQPTEKEMALWQHFLQNTN